MKLVMRISITGRVNDGVESSQAYGDILAVYQKGSRRVEGAQPTGKYGN